MKRTEHNAMWGVAKQPTDTVHCHTLGYGEFSQYDPKCAACWLGHQHSWATHDLNLGHAAVQAGTERLLKAVEDAK